MGTDHESPLLQLSPGTFWATHSSSGPVEAIYDYWQYFHPIQEVSSTK